MSTSSAKVLGLSLVLGVGVLLGGGVEAWRKGHRRTSTILQGD